MKNILKDMFKEKHYWIGNQKDPEKKEWVISTLTGSDINPVKLGLSIGAIVIGTVGLASTFFKAGVNGFAHGETRAQYLCGNVNFSPDEVKEMKLDKA